MVEGSKRLNFITFIFVSGALCLFYTLLFRPVTYEAQGDYPAYLDLAKQLYGLPGASDTDLSHRSPLYSLILGLFIIIFGEAHFLTILVVFQYILIFITSLLVYKIILQLTDNKTAAFIAGIAGVLNLTTVFFGYNDSFRDTGTLPLYFNLMAAIKISHGGTALLQCSIRHRCRATGSYKIQYAGAATGSCYTFHARAVVTPEEVQTEKCILRCSAVRLRCFADIELLGSQKLHILREI